MEEDDKLPARDIEHSAVKEDWFSVMFYMIDISLIR